MKKRIAAAAVAAALALLPFACAQMLLTETETPPSLVQRPVKSDPCDIDSARCEPKQDVVLALNETAPANKKLLTQVLKQGAFGQSECDPVLTLECRSPFECIRTIVYDAGQAYLAQRGYYTGREVWESNPINECEYRTTGANSSVAATFLQKRQPKRAAALAADGAIPEPTSWIIMMLGLFAVGAVARIRRAPRPSGAPPSQPNCRFRHRSASQP